MSTRVFDVLAAKIISGTNEKAMDILGVYGFDGFIDGTFYAPEGAVLNLLGVTKEYLRNVLYRFHIINKYFPEDIVKSGVYDFISNYCPNNRYTIESPENGEWVIYDKMKKKKKKFPILRKSMNFDFYSFEETFYSARLVLAMPTLLCCGRTIVNGGAAYKLCELLERTSYYEPAFIKSCENSVIRRSIRRGLTPKEEQITQISIEIEKSEAVSNNPPLLSTDEVTIPIDFYSNIIKAVAGV